MENNQEYKPELTLDPELDLQVAVPTLETTEAVAPKKEYELTPEEQRMVDDFAKKIDIKNSGMILKYGAGTQKKIADFSQSALENVKTKDMGEVGDMLSGIVYELKNFDKDEEEGGIFGFFKKTGNKLQSMQIKYDSAEANVNKIAEVLEGHQVQLIKDSAMLDKMYEMNMVYFKELNMYVLAGKKKLEEVRSQELPALLEKANKSGLPEDAQAVKDLDNLCIRFEKKLHDLELTRMVSLQMAPQIRLVQNNDTIMSEKIQSTLVNTIPLWKSQMLLALGVSHSMAASKAQREVTDMTNTLLKKNAQTIKMSTIETAKETERGIVDLQTLQETNQSLISTLDEVMAIQKEGREKRVQAEQELARMEGELKAKLLDVSNR